MSAPPAHDTLLAAARDPHSGAALSLGLSAAPYPGLRPFAREESDIFFGREEQVDELTLRLARARFLGLVGVSGCGKSSLLRAGLIPALETGFLASAGVQWQVAEMRPGNRPFWRLAAALAPLLGAGDLEQPLQTALFAAELRRGPRGLSTVLRENPLPAGTNLLLIVDQFEEIFRYHREVDPDETSAFVALLLESARQSEFPVYVVIAMRSDYLGECAIFQGLPEALNDSQFLTPRLSRSQRQAAIEGPAGVFGATVEPALVNQVLNDMGANPDQLPVMQHLLMRLWNRAAARGEPIGLTLADYDQVGGFTDALSRHADEVFDGLPDAHARRVAELLFRSATERLESRQDTRRPVTIREVAGVAGVEWTEVAAVVEAFRRPGNCFLNPPAGVELEAGTVIDITHESLIRRWRRLRGWVRDEALCGERYRKLVNDAHEWRDRRFARGWLLSSAELDEALAWQARTRPTKAWAARYGAELELVSGFLKRSLGRRRALRASIGFLAVLSVATAVLSGTLWARSLRDQAEAAKERAGNAKTLLKEKERANRELKKTARVYELAARSQRMRLMPGQVVASALLAVESVRRSTTLQGDEALRESLRLLPPRPQVWNSKVAGATSLRFTADGRSLLAATRTRASLLDLDGAAAARSLTTNAYDITVDATGRHLAVVDDDRNVSMLDAATGARAPRAARALGGFAFKSALTADGVLARYTDDGIEILGLDRRRPARRIALPAHDAVALGRDGRLVAISTPHSEQVEVRGLDSGRLLLGLAVGSSPVRGLDFSPDGDFLAAATHDGMVRIWSLRSGEEVARTALTAPATQVFLGWRGEHVAVANADGTRIYDRERELFRLDGVATPDAVTFSADGRSVAMSNRSGTGVWALRAGDEVFSVPLARPLAALALSPDKQHLAVATSGPPFEDPSTEVAVWHLAGGQRLFNGSIDGTVAGMKFSSGDTALVIVRTDGRVQRLVAGDEAGRTGGDAHDRRWRFEAAHRPCAAETKFAAMSGDGEHVAVAGDGVLCLADVGPPHAVERVRAASDGMVALSQDGGMVAFAGIDRQVRAFARAEPASPAPTPAMAGDAPAADLVPLLEAGATVNTLALSPDGAHLAVATWLPGVEIRELVGARRKDWLARDGVVRAIAFSGDGKHLATGGEDGSVRIWNLADGCHAAPEVSRVSHREPVTALFFGADDEYLVTVSGRVVRVLWWRTADIQREACSRLPRNLTADEWAQFVPDEPAGMTCPRLPMIHDSGALIDRVRARIRAGHPLEAVALLSAADAGSKPGSSLVRWNIACWQGSLWGYAREMHAACEQALTRDPTNAAALDTRGLVRAMAGDRRGAVADFRHYLANGDPTRQDREERERWIARLERGADALELAEMRELARE